MRDRTIYITDDELKCLRELIKAAKYLIHDRHDLKELEAELARGRVVASKQVPPDVITMHSTVYLVDLDTQEEMTYTLVFPNEADIDQNKISILAPIGIAMLGYRVGDTFEWQVPAGLRRLEVRGILYQPEAAGKDGLDSDLARLSQANWTEIIEKLFKL